MSAQDPIPNSASTGLWGDVVASTVITAAGSVELTQINGNVLTVRPDDWFDGTDVINEATRWFGGRGFVFEAFERFRARTPRGYFRLIADAGLGKTAIAAEFVRRYSALAYFLNASEGRTSADAALNALSAQVIVRFGLPYTYMPQQAGSSADWFHQRLREAAQRADEPIVVVIDALDEAAAVPAGHNWLHLPRDLPEGVCVVLTQRPGACLLVTTPGTVVEDLTIGPDQPRQRDDIRRHLVRQAERPQIQRVIAAAQPRISTDRFVTSLTDASQGNFMYLAYALAEIANGDPRFIARDAASLPRGLDAYYAQFWEQMTRLRENAWQDWSALYQPVIGLLAVAADPVTTRWLATQVGRPPNEVRDRALRGWERFLSHDPRAETWRIVHRSFADFLGRELSLTDAHRAVADWYQSPERRECWRDWDAYGLRHVPMHLVEAVGGARDDADRGELLNRLVKLVADERYWDARLTTCRRPEQLQADIESALECVAPADSATSVTQMVDVAQALDRFRRQRYRPDQVFELARHGQPQEAEEWLRLLGSALDPDWYSALRLVIAWLAADTQRDGARTLTDRVLHDGLSNQTLVELYRRVDASVHGRRVDPPRALPPSPPLAIAREIIARLSGVGADSSLLGSFSGDMLRPLARGASGRTGYLAEEDGPLLVALAAVKPIEGDDYFRRYLDVHAAYGYVQYRNRSLWVLLEAVLCHPSDEWARSALAAVGQTALARGDTAYQESLATELLAVQAAAGDEHARQSLLERTSRAIGEAQVLAHSRTEGTAAADFGTRLGPYNSVPQLSTGPALGDPWARHKRRLTTLAEAWGSIPDGRDRARELLHLANELPLGFAGFQFPAWLAVSEAARMCTGDELVIDQVLKQARMAAHNIQDPLFCVRSTARCNAFAKRWWQPFDARAAAEGLADNSNASLYAALHIVGEAYADRERGPHRLPLDSDIRDADTLAALSAAYQRPVADFLTLNDNISSVDEVLAESTHVNVPDAGMAPLLAARISAEILATKGLSPERRMRLIRRLVPVAAPDPIALDTVLSRLVMAARPDSPETLRALAAVSPPLPEIPGRPEPERFPLLPSDAVAQ